MISEEPSALLDASGPPGPTIVEVVVMGPGRGESIAVHIGAAEWLIVDSCVHQDGTPAALRYLSSIGVDAGRIVHLIASHWHDDHIRGFRDLVANCQNASVWISTALESDEFFTLVAAEPEMMVRSHSGVRELRGSLEILKSTGREVDFAMADRRLYQRSPSPGVPAVEVWSLSPSSSSVKKALERFAVLKPVPGMPKRAIPTPPRNPSCVVLLVKVGSTELLLGADLEDSSDLARGWAAIVSAPGRPRMRAQFVKVPHHGSSDAHSEDMWSELLVEEPQAAVTPFQCGNVRLPKDSDIRRITGLTPNAWITRRDSGAKQARRRPRAVERTLNEVVSSIRTVSVEPARLVFRCEADSPETWVQLSPPPATLLTDLVESA